MFLLYLLSELDSKTGLFSIAYFVVSGRTECHVFTISVICIRQQNTIIFYCIFLWCLAGQSVSQLEGLTDLGSEYGYQPVKKLLFGAQMPFTVPLLC